MRFLHCSDLHLGRRLCELDLLEDQKYILDQLLDIAASEGVDAVLVAGDVYDKGVPSLGRWRCWTGFLTALCERHTPVYLDQRQPRFRRAAGVWRAAAGKQRGTPGVGLRRAAGALYTGG